MIPGKNAQITNFIWSTLFQCSFSTLQYIYVYMCVFYAYIYGVYHVYKIYIYDINFSDFLSVSIQLLFFLFLNQVSDWIQIKNINKDGEILAV